MDWPPIQVPFLGRSGMIALIALLHIPFFVNFVMGAPVIAVISEWLGRRTGDTRYDTLSKHLSNMVLVTVAVGALGGIGLVISNLGLFPRFFTMGAGVFFWPLLLEILAFLMEAVFLSIYRYTWDRMKHRPLHLFYGFLGAFGAWLSGFIINGLASFMLTPGNWPQSRSVLDAAFNPSMLPSYLHRAVAAFSVTGFFLIVYAVWMYGRSRTDEGKSYATWAVGYAGKWAVIATALQFFPGVWYLTALERGTSLAAPEGSVIPKLLNGPLTFFWFGGIMLAVAAILLVWFLAVQSPKTGMRWLGRMALVAAVLLILTTTAFMGFTRERARKPYLVYGVMYGNQIMVPGMEQSAAADPQAGQQVFLNTGCTGCHQLQGKGGSIVLDGVGTRRTADQIRQTILNPPQGMAKFKIKSADLENLVAFLASQK